MAKSGSAGNRPVCRKDGLSIARRIVEKLGGQVGVESDGVPGQGSVFSFTLPVAADPG
jgi:signal transduction histidine kinase